MEEEGLQTRATKGGVTIVNLKEVRTVEDEQYSVCPFCKDKVEAFEYCDYTEIECDACGSVFQVERIYSCSYDNIPLKPPTKMDFKPVLVHENDPELAHFQCPRCAAEVGDTPESDREYVEEFNARADLYVDSFGITRRKLSEDFTTREDYCPKCEMFLDWSELDAQLEEAKKEVTNEK